MDTMDYFELVTNAFEKVEALQKQRETLDAEIMKLEQFISATANFLPDDQRDLMMKRMQVTQDLQRVRDSGLTEAVRIVLAAAEDWLTVAQVRDRLMTLGFDFSLYSTNPLASISTTLRRMKPEEVETRTTNDGVMAYRWKKEKSGLTPPSHLSWEPVYSSGMRGDEKPRVRVPFTRKKE
jgi:hypothetical protein